MKKDIHPPAVEDIAIAIVREKNELDEVVWNVYMLNLKDRPIEGVLVTSKGYGYFEGEDVKTSVLRHFLDVIPAKSYAKVEPIVESLFGLNNEFWVSFYLDKVMYDKKYVFLAESVREDNFIHVPFIDKKGVMIR